MAEGDGLLETIEALHAAGLDESLWPNALASTAALLGGAAATLESYDQQRQLRELQAFGIPAGEQSDYVEHFAAINPRTIYCLRRPHDPLHWDYKILDERAMNRDAFYSEFLPRTDFRYFVTGQWAPPRGGMGTLSVQRTRKQGHVGKSQIGLMAQLLPHVRLAFDTTMRLRAATGISNALRDALDWLADGVLLVRRDGTFAYANAAMEAIARRDDGISLTRNRIEFRAVQARERFDKALAALAQLRHGEAAAWAADFRVARRSGRGAYLVSLRPLPRSRRIETDTHVIAMAFVRDTDRPQANASRLQREVFGFTAAEVGVAQALLAGIPLGDYARRRDVTLNTVYTHLRRIKEKTGCSRLPELIRKLNDLQLPLRGD